MEKRKRSTTLWSALLFLGLLGAAAALRFVALDKSMWVDEATSYVIGGQKNIHGVLALSSARFTAHPPLYYLLVYFWFGLFGKSLVAMRALSAVFGLFCVAMMYPLAAALFRRRSTGFVAMAIAAFSPFAVYISQIGRMYSLLTLLTMIAVWAFIRLADERAAPRARLGMWALLAVSMTALLYTHYYGANVIGLLCAMAFLRSRVEGKAFLWKWALLLAVVAAGWFPWMKVFAAQSRAMAHIMNVIFPGPAQNLQYLMVLIGSGMVFSGVPLVTLTMEQFTALFVFSSFTILAFMIWSILLCRNNKQIAPVFLYLAVPTAMMFVSAALVKGIVFQWHFGYISPAAMLFAAFALTFGKSRIAKAFLVFVSIVVGVIGLQAYYRAGFWNDDWRSVSRHIIKYSAKNDIVLSMLPLNDFPMKDYYLTGTGIKVESVFSAAEQKRIGTAPAVVFSDIAYSRDCFWAVGAENMLAADPGPEWLAVHFKTGRKKIFPAVFTQNPIQAMRLCLRDEDKKMRSIQRAHFVEYLSTAWKKQEGNEGRFARADYLFSKGYAEMAEQEMRAALGSNPDMPEAMLNLGYIVRARGRRNEALGLFLQAQKLKPGDRRAKFLAGETLFLLRRDKEAMAELEKLRGDKDFGSQAEEILDEISRDEKNGLQNKKKHIY